MKEDFSELVEYLDGKFTHIEEGFLSVGQQLADLRANKADKTDVNELMTAIDAYAKKADTCFQEMVMLSRKVERHEKWFQQIADKLGIKLKY